MTKRSAAVVELENQLREMLGPSGGLIETRWVGRLVDLMKVTANTEGRNYLVKVLLNTPQTDRATLTRFIQLEGIEILGQWIGDHKTSPEQDDKQVIHSILSCLNKLQITMEILNRTKIGIVVKNLGRHQDPSIQAKASSIVSKWKKMVTNPDEGHRPEKKVKETRVQLQKKQSTGRQRVEELQTQEVYPPPSEELYIPPNSPPNYEPIIVDQQRTNKKTVRWVDDNKLESVKYFRYYDEPNATCASKRPEEDQGELLPRMQSVEDFRRKETQMERELHRKVLHIQEKEKGMQIRQQLDNMTPRIVYSGVVRKFQTAIKALGSTRVQERQDSQEKREQERREQGVLKMIYQRESDVPITPRDNDNATFSRFSDGTPPILATNAQAVTTQINPEPQPNYQKQSMMNPMAASVPPTSALPAQGVPQYMMNPYAMGQNPMMDPSMMYRFQGMPQMGGVMPGMQQFGGMRPGFPPVYPKVLINNWNNKPMNYRTEPCRNFHSTTGCTHGDNCHFIHDFEHAGRQIPNLEQWRRTNNTRLQNINAMKSANMGMATYYPPAGPETHKPENGGMPNAQIQ